MDKNRIFWCITENCKYSTNTNKYITTKINYNYTLKMNGNFGGAMCAQVNSLYISLN